MTDFTELPDLASETLGGAVLACNDEFFAPKENLIKAGEPVWLPDEYTDRGKWMDGWESRRRREPGHDWAILRLGLPGVIHGVVVDTSYFRGNFPESCSVQACELPPSADLVAVLNDAVWRDILPRTRLEGNSRNSFAIRDSGRVTHLRLNIFPDGGVARLRVHGLVTPDWDYIDFRGGFVDLAAIEHGGRVLACSDQFFGRAQELTMPGLTRDMSEGWETRRRRGPGHDWAILQLGARGLIDRVDVDTSHFIGNAPGACSLEACATDQGLDHLLSDACAWQTLLPRTQLEPHRRHTFVSELRTTDMATHVRFNIYPDGGVARLRLLGMTARSQDIQAAVLRLGARTDDEFAADMLACCGSRAFARRMAGARPYFDFPSLARMADRVWAELDRSDWLEAFAAHPRIGQSKAASDRFASWSTREQAGVKGADPGILDELAQRNDEYYQRFGFIFIVFASGKSARTMLDLLRSRLQNEPDEEVAIAAEEQRKITRLRLAKLVRGMTEEAPAAAEAST